MPEHYSENTLVYGTDLLKPNGMTYADGSASRFSPELIDRLNELQEMPTALEAFEVLVDVLENYHFKEELMDDGTWKPVSFSSRFGPDNEWVFFHRNRTDHTDVVINQHVYDEIQGNTPLVMNVEDKIYVIDFTNDPSFTGLRITKANSLSRDKFV